MVIGKNLLDHSLPGDQFWRSISYRATLFDCQAFRTWHDMLRPQRKSQGIHKHFSRSHLRPPFEMPNYRDIHESDSHPLLKEFAGSSTLFRIPFQVLQLDVAECYFSERFRKYIWYFKIFTSHSANNVQTWIFCHVQIYLTRNSN